MKYLDWAIQSYNNGASISNMSLVLGLSEYKLRYVLKDKVTMRPKGVVKNSKNRKINKNSREIALRVIEERKKGGSIKEIAELLDRTRQSIYSLFSNYNFIIAPNPPLYSEKTQSNVLRNYYIYEDIHYVAYKLDLDSNCIREILKLNNVSFSNQKKMKIPYEKYGEIYQLKLSGVSTSSLAQKYDVSHMTMHRILKSIKNEELLEHE